MEMCISMDSLIDQALIIGEGKPYLSALVVLDAETAGKEGLDPANLSQTEEEMLLQRVNAQLDNFPGYAKIVRLSVVKEPWTIENGLVTPTMKLKRKVIFERYADNLNRLYDGH